MADRGWGILSGTVEVLAYPAGGLAYIPRVPVVRSRGAEGQESEIGGVPPQTAFWAASSPKGRAKAAVGGGWGDVLKKFPIEGNFFSREGR